MRKFAVVVATTGRKPVRYPLTDGASALASMETFTGRGVTKLIALTSANGIEEELNLEQMREIFGDEPQCKEARLNVARADNRYIEQSAPEVVEPIGEYLASGLQASEALMKVAHSAVICEDLRKAARCASSVLRELHLLAQVGGVSSSPDEMVYQILAASGLQVPKEYFDRIEGRRIEDEQDVTRPRNR